MATTTKTSKIPTDSTGHVPESALLKRYKEYYDAQQEAYEEKRLAAAMKGERLPEVNLAQKDYNYTSDTVIPLRCTPGQVARWWDDPSSCDVQDIDCAGAPKTNVPRGTPGQMRDQGHIKVVATPAEEKKLRRELMATFDDDDLHKIAESRPTYAVKPTGTSYKGRYVPSRDRVELDRSEGFDQGVVAHETVHLLRDRDERRGDKVLIVSNPNPGVEESCTVAEQMARSDKPDYTGYYQHVAVWDPKRRHWRSATPSEARRMAEEDHALFTEGRRKGLKGDEALESVQRNWGSSHIARMWTSQGMAVNVIAREYGVVEPVSMAKPRTKAEKAAATELTNATAGRPGVATANTKSSGTRQTTLFGRRRRSETQNVKRKPLETP